MSEKEKKENFNESIDKETLIQLLKDKSKEIKVTQTKLQKLENKYVSIFKDQKKYIKDRENFMKFLEIVFSNNMTGENQKIIQANLGEIDNKELQNEFFSRESQKEEAMNKVMMEYNEEKIKMENKYQNKIKNQAVNSDDQSAISSMEAQIDELETNNLKLTKEIIELNQIIKNKNEQIAFFEQQDDLQKKIKTEQLINELQMNNQKTSDVQNINRKIKEAEMQNQILDLLKKLEKSNEKIQQYEQQFSTNNSTKNKIPQQSIQAATLQQSNDIISKSKQHKTINSETQTDSILDLQSGQFVDRQNYENELFNKQFGLQIENQKKQQISFKKNDEKQDVIQDLNNENQEEQQDYLNSKEYKIKQKEEYLKNVIFKYFEYVESRQHKEAQLLQSSIMTILQMSTEERSKIEIAKKQGSIWNSTLSYIPFINKAQELNQNKKNDNYQSEILQTQ